MEGIKKLQELMHSDETFQQELKGTHTLSADELEQVFGGIDSIFGIPLCGIFGDTNKNDCPCPMGISPDRLSQ